MPSPTADLSRVLAPRVLASRSAEPDSDESIQGLLQAVRQHLGMDVAFVAAFEDGRRVFRHVDAAPGVDAVRPGQSDPLEATYCQRQVDGRLPAVIPDTSELAETASLPVTRALRIGSYVGVPLRMSDGSVYGTFCCFGSRPDRSLNERDLAVVQLLARMAESLLQRDFESARETRRRRERIESVLQGDELMVVYQPIVEVATGRLGGVESLSRITAEPARSPELWFVEAAQVGLHVDLEVRAVERALAALDGLPAQVYVACNVSPPVAASHELGRALEGHALDRMVLEVTEHAAIECYEELLGALAPWRQQGLRLAIDDAGAGYASFRHILSLSPDIIKLDQSLTRHVDSDPSRRALAAAMVRFCSETGARLVAEGVETRAELDTLRALGVTHAQGYFLGRPGPLSGVGLDGPGGRRPS